MIGTDKPTIHDLHSAGISQIPHILCDGDVYARSSDARLWQHTANHARLVWLRIHTRLVFAEVGRRLVDYKNLKELVANQEQRQTITTWKCRILERPRRCMCYRRRVLHIRASRQRMSLVNPLADKVALHARTNESVLAVSILRRNTNMAHFESLYPRICVRVQCPSPSRCFGLFGAG